MTDYNINHDELPLKFSIMDKVREHGYNHLAAYEQVQLAYELIGYKGDNPGFQSLRELFDALPGKLDQYFSKDQITRLKTIKELSAQYLKEGILKRDSIIGCPSDVRDYLKLKIGGESKESMVCIFVDAKNRPINFKIVAQGTVDKAVIYPREILKEALDCHAVGIVLAHNHPSGEPDPSGNDIHLTGLIQKGAEALDIKLLDHMIVTGDKYFSFQEENIMDKKNEYNVSTNAKTKKVLINNSEISSASSDVFSKGDLSESFIEAIEALKKQEKNNLNRRFQGILGCSKLQIDDLPKTMYIINKTFNSYISEYKSSGYVDFDKVQEQIGLNGISLNTVFNREVYSFFENNFLDKSDLKKFERLIPDVEIRQNLFADYARKKPIDLSEYTQREESFILRMFKKILRSFTKILGKKNELETLFEDFTKGKYGKVQNLTYEKGRTMESLSRQDNERQKFDRGR